MILEKIFRGLTNALTLLIVSSALSSCSLFPLHKSETGFSSEIFNLEPKAPPPLVMDNTAPQKSSREKHASDMWERLRDGMSLRTVDSKRVQYYLNYFADNPHIAEHIFESAKPYLRYITDELDKRNMPLEIAMLPAVESGFNPRAVSSSNAKGLWQFIAHTGKYYRLAQNQDYDGRLDVVASTNAALNYLGDLYTELDGNWILALTAYNSGLSSVKRAMKKNSARKLPTNFESLRLRKETTDYVPKLVAFSEIVKHPKRYGIHLPAIENTEVVKPIKLEKPASLNAIARSSGVSISTLEALNPGYLGAVTPSGENHYLLAPRQAEQKIMLALNHSSTSGTPPIEIAQNTSQTMVHKILKGEYLNGLARKYGTTVESIRKANHLNSDLIIAGRDLLIPTMATPVAGSMLAKANTAHADSTTVHAHQSTPDKPASYQVMRGDNLTRLAKRFSTTVESIQKENHLDSTLIIAGQNLVIPARQGTTATVLAKSRRDIKPPSRIASRISRTNQRTVVARNTMNSRPDVGDSKISPYNPPQSTQTTRSARDSSGFLRKTGLTQDHGDGDTRTNRVLYRVGNGDTLWAISKYYRVAIRKIRQWNNLSPSTKLTQGQTLTLYPPI